MLLAARFLASCTLEVSGLVADHVNAGFQKCPRRNIVKVIRSDYSDCLDAIVRALSIAAMVTKSS